MAKGEGGGGHFAERRAQADRDEAAVLRAITKPRPEKKPVIVERKKKRSVVIPQAKPSRVKVESDAGTVPEFGSPIHTTTYNSGLRSGAAAAEKRMHYTPSPEIRSVGDFVEKLRTRAKRARPAQVYPTPNRAAKGNPGGAYTTKADIAAATADPYVSSTAAKSSLSEYPTPNRAAKGNPGGAYTPRADVENQFGKWVPGGGARHFVDWLKLQRTRRLADT